MWLTYQVLHFSTSETVLCVQLMGKLVNVRTLPLPQAPRRQCCWSGDPTVCVGGSRVLRAPFPGCLSLCCPCTWLCHVGALFLSPSSCFWPLHRSLRSGPSSRWSLCSHVTSSRRLASTISFKSHPCLCPLSLPYFSLSFS